MFKRAIVRKPGESLTDGITNSNLGKSDIKRALAQHMSYINALERCGLELIVLRPEERFPDSVFVEDVALCTNQCAILTRPGAATREGEVGLIDDTIRDYFEVVEKIEYPGTIEGGDIMMVENHFYIGLSDRTNLAGAEQMLTILQRLGYTGSTVSLERVLHLKTGVSYLENNNLLVWGEFAHKKEFERFNRITVSEEEGYAANSIWINGNVLVPDGYPKTSEIIRDTGYNVIVLDVSEFQKLDGGLSCLSLRF